MENAAGRPGASGWYHGWNIVAVCVLAGIAASSLPVNGFSLFLHDWSADLHVSYSTLQIGISEMGVGCAVFAPVAGMIIDRYPTRHVLAAGLVGIAVFCIALSYVTQIWQYLTLYAVILPLSVLCSTTMPANAVVMRWFVRRLGLALGLTAVGLSLAGIVMAPLIAAVMPALGWRLIWRIGGVLIAVVVLPLVLLVVRERPAERDGAQYLSHDGAAAAQHGHGAPGATDKSIGWLDILSRRNFWLLVVAYLTMLSIYGGAGYNLTPIAASRGLSVQMAGLLLSGYSLSQMCAALGGGILSDRFGNRLPLAGLAFLTAAGGVVITFGHGFMPLLLGALLVGVGGGFWPLVGSALASEFGAKGFGRAFGALMVFLPIGSSPAFIVAKVRESTGSYAPALLVMVGLAIIGGVASLMLRERRGDRPMPAQEAPAADAAVPLL